MLMKHRSDKTRIDSFGDTALDIARATGNNAVANVLTNVSKLQSSSRKLVVVSRFHVHKK